ncbi:MAG: signal peptidase II [Candidatus Aminicenantes bacterium]|nr:signal peptidase II [Candidatus Aminicenantes bacterium]
MKRFAPYAALAGLVIVLDQVSKALIVAHVPFYGSVRLIPGFLKLTHIHNKGAILGLFNSSEYSWAPALLLVLNAAALALVLYYFSKTTDEERAARFGLALIVGGALGNVIDRIARGFVVDFIEMSAGSFHWPTYNIADSCITIGAVVLVWSVIFRRPHASDPV